ncbi:hypothetical protein ACQR1I_01710 [Bradyrhizobium sp. HKCCYLS2038]|uniref:hypothetical protein n=1 Tax=unclassified Bradyrhizobium TaxID=2631580 RepID=UPI003EC115D3
MDPQETAARVVVALRAGTLAGALNSIYPELLRDMVVPHPIVSVDRKDLISFQKQLFDEEAFQVLLVIWRESAFVLDEHLSHVGLVRHFSTSAMTAYGLATKLAESPQELAKVSTRVQNIVAASEVFGLVEREASKSKSRPLTATQRLNELILKWACVHDALILEYARSVLPDRADLKLQQ